MIYRWDDLYESQDFEHDQKFVKAEHWREACDELEDKTKTLKQTQEELSQARKLIAELVKMGKFYADKNNYAGRRSKSDIFSNIIGDNTIYPDRTAFGGRYARDVLSNNKDIIEKLTKE